jgi:hypothetical protein
MSKASGITCGAEDGDLRDIAKKGWIEVDGEVAAG